MGTFFGFKKITASERATRATHFIGRFQTALALNHCLLAITLCFCCFFGLTGTPGLGHVVT